MKKTIIAISLVLGVMLLATGFVIAGGVEKIPEIVNPSGTEIKVPQQTIDSSSANKRIIAPTTSKIDKFIFKMKGCKIMHELNDATALTCPEAVAKGLKNVREDRIFHILDLEADEQIGADDVWAQGIDGINGTGVNVAVLDTGIDTDHPEL